MRTFSHRSVPPGVTAASGRTHPWVPTPAGGRVLEAGVAPGQATEPGSPGGGRSAVSLPPVPQEGQCHGVVVVEDGDASASEQTDGPAEGVDSKQPWGRSRGQILGGGWGRGEDSPFGGESCRRGPRARTELSSSSSQVYPPPPPRAQALPCAVLGPQVGARGPQPCLGGWCSCFCTAAALTSGPSQPPPNAWPC